MNLVSYALDSLNLGLPFTLGDEVAVEGSRPGPWKLYDATRKKDSLPVSVFEYAENAEAPGKNASSALRKLKLPGVVKYYDTVESGKRVYILTERVAALKPEALSTDARKYVVYSLLQTLNTLHTVAKCSHNDVGARTVMLSAATGQPVLVGFDFATFDDQIVPAYRQAYSTSDAPPEGWSSPTWDSFQFGVFTAALLPAETRLYNSLRAQRRPAIPKLAASQSAQSILLTPLTTLVGDMNQAVLLPPHDVARLCERVDELEEALYPSIVQGTILPELLKVKSPATLRTNLKLISQLADPLADFDPIAQYIVEQFASMDRVVRIELLRYLPQYVGVLSDRLVQQNIMPRMAFGFGDTEVVVRKASVAVVEYLVPKLTSRQLNTELLRMLAKTHNDPDPDVRALTTTVLCRLVPKIDNRSVIATAVGRALKDPVPQCRQAALRGVKTIEAPAKEIAEKLLGPAASGMLDKDPIVATEASQVTDYLLTRIRKESNIDPELEKTDLSAAPEKQFAEAVQASKAPEVYKSSSAELLAEKKPLAKPSNVPRPAFGATNKMKSPPPSVPTPLSTLAGASLPAQSQQTVLDESANDDTFADDAWGWNEEDEEEDEEGQIGNISNANNVEQDESLAENDDPWSW